MIRRVPKVLAASALPWLLIATLVVPGCARHPRIETLAGVAQGTTYTLQWWSAPAIDTAALSDAVTRELERIDELLSNYRPDSVVERLNAAKSTDPLAVPGELVDLLRLADRLNRASAGCFDPTVRPLVHLWGFDGDDPHVPADAAVASTLASVGLDKLAIVDDGHVRKLQPDVQIDMSSLGQGYTVGQLAAVLESLGVQNYLVEIGGELAGRGHRPDGTSWRVGIEDPDSPNGVLRALSLPPDRLTAVITSGTYRHYFEQGGRVYGHILDPRTGRPVEHALVAVTVTGPVAEAAAGWATALVCLGPEDGAATAEREHLAAAFVVRTEGKPELSTSGAFGSAWPGSR